MGGDRPQGAPARDRSTSGRLKRWFGIAAAVAAFLAAVLAIASYLGVGPLGGGSDRPARLSLEAKTRLPKGAWSDRSGVRRGQMAIYGVHVVNIGDERADRLSLRVVPAPRDVRVVPGSCRMRVDSGALESCGQVAKGGLSITSLPGRSSIDVTVAVRVDRDAPGGLLRGKAIVNSDDTPELTDSLDLAIPVSRAESEVRSLYDSERENAVGFWRHRPILSAGSKRFLIERWARLNPHVAHSFSSIPNGPIVSTRRLFYDWRLNARVVDLSAYVLADPQTARVVGRRAVLSQTFPVGVNLGDPVAWCETTRRKRYLLHAGDWVWVRGVSFARGQVEWGGQARGVTAMACPGVRRLKRSG